MNDYILIKKSTLKMILLATIILLPGLLFVLSGKAQSGVNSYTIQQTAEAALKAKDYVEAHGQYTAYLYMVSPTINQSYLQYIKDRRNRIRNYLQSMIIFDARTCNERLIQCQQASVSGRYANPVPTLTPYPTPTPLTLDALNPPPDMVYLCENYNYKGACQFYPVGTYNTIWITDAVSSFKIGNKVKLKVCYDFNMTQPCATFTADQPRLGEVHIAGNITWNDHIRSIQVSNR